MSTKMMPVPALEQLEREISGVLNKMTDIRREGYQRNTFCLLSTLQRGINESLLAGSELVIEGDGRTEKFVAE